MLNEMFVNDKNLFDQNQLEREIKRVFLSFNIGEITKNAWTSG